MKRIDGLIWKYFLKGKKGKEANRLERLALNDPFLYEALEGMEGVEGDHQQIVAQLQQKIKIPRSRNRIFYRAAAAIVLLGGLAAGLLYRPDKPVPLAGVEFRRDSARNDIAATVVAATSPEIQRDSVKIAKQAVWADDLSPAVKESLQIERSIALDEAIPECAEQAPEEMVKPAQKGNIPVSLSEKKIIPGSQQARDSGVLQDIRITGYAAGTQERMVRKKRQKHREIPGQRARIKNTWRNDFQQYVADSLRYPPAEQKNKVEGEVVLSVHLNKRNRPSRIKVVRKLSPACDREARRLVVEYPGVWSTEARDFTVTVRFSLKAD